MNKIYRHATQEKVIVGGGRQNVTVHYICWSQIKITYTRPR